MGALQYIATSALSLTLSGNTGVAPFLTLLIVGVIEKSDPSLLHMEGWIEKVVSSWPSIVVFAVLSVLEFVGKCVPCIDAVIDSAMTFVVPILSVFGSLASFGLFTANPDEGVDPQEGLYVNVTDILLDDGGGRRLQEKSGGLIFLQVILCFFGIFLALLVHLFKLLVRVLGEGCCTCCITSVEYTWIVGSVTLTIFIVPIAIGTAILLIAAAGIGFKRKVWDKRKEKKEKEKEEARAEVANGESQSDSKGGDEEQAKKAAAGEEIDGIDNEEVATNQVKNLNTSRTEDMVPEDEEKPPDVVVKVF